MTAIILKRIFSITFSTVLLQLTIYSRTAPSTFQLSAKKPEEQPAMSTSAEKAAKTSENVVSFGAKKDEPSSTEKPSAVDAPS